MKGQIISIFFLIMCPLFLQGQDLDMKSPGTEKSKKEIRKEKRKLARKQLTQHFNIGANATYTFVNSSARFEGKNSILSAQIKLGVHAESIKVNRHVTYIAATPNFGFVASFRIKKWFTIGGAVGMFFYNTKNLSGTFYDLGIFGEFYPVKWIGLNIGYKVFNVSVKFPEENYNAYIDYNLRGPSAGIRFRF